MERRTAGRPGSESVGEDGKSDSATSGHESGPIRWSSAQPLSSYRAEPYARSFGFGLDGGGRGGAEDRGGGGSGSRVRGLGSSVGGVHDGGGGGGGCFSRGAGGGAYPSAGLRVGVQQQPPGYSIPLDFAASTTSTTPGGGNVPAPSAGCFVFGANQGVPGVPGPAVILRRRDDIRQFLQNQQQPWKSEGDSGDSRQRGFPRLVRRTQNAALSGGASLAIGGSSDAPIAFVCDPLSGASVGVGMGVAAGGASSPEAVTSFNVEAAAEAKRRQKRKMLLQRSARGKEKMRKESLGHMSFRRVPEKCDERTSMRCKRKRHVAGIDTRFVLSCRTCENTHSVPYTFGDYPLCRKCGSNEFLILGEWSPRSERSGSVDSGDE